MKFRRSGINAAISPQTSQPANWHERISLDLAQNFHVDDQMIEPSGADLAIREGSRVAVVEVKTGDPNLPLPSSTASQMRMYVADVQKKVDPAQEMEVFPVLVTNYQVSSADRQELADQGIKIVEISPAESLYDRNAFFNSFSSIVGFQKQS